MFHRIYQQNKDNDVKLAFADGKDRRKIYSFNDYFDIVAIVAKAFLRLGLKAGDSVCIVATNCPEWCFSHFGAIEAGGIAVGIDPKRKKETIIYCLKKCSAKILISDSRKLMDVINKLSTI